MDVIKLIGDPRITVRSAEVNGYTYGYLYAEPTSGKYHGTVFMIHGFPDLSFGWRYQIPVILDLGFRIVCPDSLGYGFSSAPEVPPESMTLYGQRRASDDIKELARQLGASQIILGGHDWGGQTVWRSAMFHPELVTHMFLVGIPFIPPMENFVPIEILAVNHPTLAYQKQFGSSEVESRIQSKEQIQQFLNSVYGHWAPYPGAAFDPERGCIFENLVSMEKNNLLSDEEMDIYVEQFSRRGLNCPLNNYRNRETNYQDEVDFKPPFSFTQPVLFIASLRDTVLTPSMAKDMEKYVPQLTRREVDGAHFAHVEKAEEVNGYVKEWFESVVLGGKGLA